MILTESIEQAKNLIKKEKHPIIVSAINSEFDRKILEYGKFDILLISKNFKFNHILAKIASKNGISLGIDLKEIRSLEEKDKTKRLGKIKEIIPIARKNKVNIALLNKKSKVTALNLMLNLGASSSQAKQAISF